MSERALHSKAKAFQEKGQERMKSAVLGVTTSIAGWSALGFVLGLAAWLGERWGDLLEIDWPPWSTVVWLLLVAYMLGGALLFAKAGLARGVGGVLLHVGVELGYVAFLVERIIDGMIASLRDSGTLSEDTDDRAAMTAPLPFDALETAMMNAVNDIIDHGDGVVEDNTSFQSRLLSRTRAMLCDLIEQGTLEALRGEEQVTLERVRKEALQRLEQRFEESVRDLMNSARDRAWLLAILAFSVVPIVAYFV